MSNHICSKVETSVRKYLSDEFEVSHARDYCVVTLPLKTVDGGWVSIIVEQKYDNYFLVHDGGKTDSELFSQGITMTEANIQTHEVVAAKFGVTIGNRMIQRACSEAEIGEAVLAVGQCAAMMTTELVWSSTEIDEGRVQTEVFAALSLWKPDEVQIKQGVSLDGALTNHKFNFVATSGNRNAAINILLSGRGKALEKAERYGFAWLDMERKSAEYKNWARGVVIPRVENWSRSALSIVKEFANDTIEFRSDQESELQTQIPKLMARLTNPIFSPGERSFLQRQ